MSKDTMKVSYAPDFINIADRVRLIRPMGDKFQIVGQAFEIGGITEEHYVIRDTKHRIAIGSVNVSEFGKYFVKEENKCWSDWCIIPTDDNNGVEAYYRTNGKKVQCKIGKYKAEASCLSTDNFSVLVGINLALYRCKVKKIKGEISALQCELVGVENQLKQTLDYANQK